MNAPFEIEGLEKKVADNHFNYTEEQLQEKKLALKTMLELYPGVEPYYAELVYDLCKNSTQEEIDIIKHKVETTPPKHKIPKI